MEEGNIAEVNKEINGELTKLIKSMSGLNIEHERALNDCYAEYFNQKVKEFERVEKEIGLFVRSFSAKASNLAEIQLAGDVYKEREECLFNIRESFSCINEEGFGIDRRLKCGQLPNGYTSAQSQMASTSSSSSSMMSTSGDSSPSMRPTSGDNFCDFVLKDLGNDCDNGIEMVGYSMANSEPRSSNSLNSHDIDTSPFSTDEGTSYLSTDDGNSYEEFPRYRQSNIPPRLRFKRHFTLMTTPESPSPPCSDDSYSNETEVKRRRESQFFDRR